MAASLTDTLRHVRWTRVALLFFAVLIPLLIVGAIAEDLLEQQRFAFEAPLLLAIHARAMPAFDHLAVALNYVGGWQGMAPLSALILAWLWLRSHTSALFFLIGVGGAALLSYVMKFAFHRPRPELWPRLVTEPSASFPSGHAMVSAALVVALMFLAWRTPYRWPAVVLGTLWTLVVGFSRLYLGVHYPTDVLVGWLAGTAWVAGAHLISVRRG